MRKKHAEIAGGGIAGLSLALMLARTGWSVCVHERSPEVREVGAGIFLRNNSIEVLEEFGVFDTLRRRGSQLTDQFTIDKNDSVMERRSLTGMSQVTVLTRQALMEEMLGAAQRAGVEIVTDSKAIGIEAEGVLVLNGGQRRKADLVVAADGIYSSLRPALGQTDSPRVLPTTINRYLLPHSDFAPDPVHREYWGINRRIGIAPAGPDATYVYQVCRTRDHAAAKLPTDAALWSGSIPVLKDLFDAMAAAPSIPHQYLVVRCHKWSKGRATIIGDAAHGMPPTLGQGAGLAIMNARGLVTALQHQDDVPAALQMWERSIRHITDRTQNWAVRFDVFANRYPDSLAFLRRPVVWTLVHVPIVNKRMRIAERGIADTPLGMPLALNP